MVSRAGYFLASRRFSALTRGRTNAADVTSDVVLDGLGYLELATAHFLLVVVVVMLFHSRVLLGEPSALNRRRTDDAHWRLVHTPGI